MTTDTTAAMLQHEIGSDGLLVLTLASGDLRLRGAAGGAIRVRARGGDSLDGLAVERGDGSLTIRGGRSGLASFASTPDLDIELPATANVVVEVASADIAVDGLTGDQRYRSGSGDIVIRGAGGRLAVEAMSGDVDIVASGPGRYDLRTVSGDLELHAQRIDGLRAATTSGDLTLEGGFAGEGPFLVESVSGDIRIAPAGDVRVDVRTISGDLRSALPGRMEEADGRRSFISGAGGPAIDVRSTSGDVHIGRAAATVAPVAPPSPALAPPISPPPAGPTAPTAAIDDDPGLDVLRALERGEIDLDEARTRLAALDGEPAVATAPDAEAAAGADRAADADTAVVPTAMAPTSEETDDGR